MFTEESRSTAVAGSAESGDYKYKVNYNTDGKSLTSLHCNVYKKTSEEVTTSTASRQLREKSMPGLCFRNPGTNSFLFRKIRTSPRMLLCLKLYLQKLKQV